MRAYPLTQWEEEASRPVDKEEEEAEDAESARLSSQLAPRRRYALTPSPRRDALTPCAAEESMPKTVSYTHLTLPTNREV